MSNKTKVVLKISKVMDRTAQSRSSIYLKISQGLFPKPIKLGKRSVGWLESDIDNWIDNLVEKQKSN